jgi:DNA-directed RNA polymerase specialized sigma24 family protein
MQACVDSGVGAPGAPGAPGVAGTRVARAAGADRARVLRRREAVERVLDAAGHLADADRVLLDMLYRDGRPVSDVADLLGRPRHAVRRRVRRLLRRVHSRRFRFALRHAELLPPPVRAVARAHVLQGLTLRQTARRTGLPLHTVREHARTLAILPSLLPGR